MWADNETAVDFLGFKVHSDLIKSVVTNPNLLPTTIGLFGDWGSGKTSIMKMLEHDLDPNSYTEQADKEKYEKILCIYFNGWLFEGYDDAKAAILTSVLNQIAEKKKLTVKMREKVSDLIQSVNWMRIAKFSVKEVGLPALAAYLTGGASLIPTAVSKAKSLLPGQSEDEKGGSEEKKESELPLNEFINERQLDSIHMDVRTFRERFSELLEECNIDSLVVLIDDLDRCSPERIIDNLEAIKLFLNVPNTSFVIGADPRIVRHAIQVRYNSVEFDKKENNRLSSDTLINDYLEKLIQVPYYVPRLSPAEVESYMTLLFCNRDITEAEMFDSVYTHCNEQRQKNRYATFGYSSVNEVFTKQGTTVPETLSNSLGFCSSISQLITEGLNGNPRQIKRFLNAYTLRKQLAEVASLEEIKDDILVKLMVLEYSHPREFRQLFEWQATQEGLPEQIKVLEVALSQTNSKSEEVEKVDPNWSTSFMRKWISMEPYLSDIDLRDYFWVARDKLASTFSGLSMVSPIVRIALKDLISDISAKQNQAIEAVKGFSEQERASLLDIIATNAVRNPDQSALYKGIRLLVENDIEGSVSTYCRVIKECNHELAPASEGIAILTLMNTKPALKSELESLITILKDKPDTRIGKAIIASERRKK
ncbi:P-loop NTPase fold protein [Exiguobacterium sp. s154]|uniref:KAP family P-loop NTPase fold protein n=1 Tax=Exiguobacterium sp. s154 TaxID=2751277 RepID=UPI001BE6B979|nr:P-loop NTPase fold protein [Exiguobacterium sp. s154]